MKTLDLGKLKEVPSSVFYGNKTFDFVPIPVDVLSKFKKDNSEMNLHLVGVVSGGKWLFGSTFGKVMLVYSRQLNRLYVEWHSDRVRFYIVELDSIR